ncbi:MAG: hypothetical protein JO069_19880 [Verrucomicrobia bacterium]|nr:hypothetical protein [Verrucomicrobiota bacterium]
MDNQPDALNEPGDRGAPAEPSASGASDPAVNNIDIPERLKQLAADPNYPSPEIIKSIAEKMIDLFRSE